MQMKNQNVSIRQLMVLDRREIGPVELAQDRLVAPYKVTVNDQSDTNHLIYKYEESVFQPENPADQNLAAMIAALMLVTYIPQLSLFIPQLLKLI